MNGIEFYNFLRQFYNQNGQPLYGNFTFCDWLLKPDETYSLVVVYPLTTGAPVVVYVWVVVFYTRDMI